MNFFILTVAMLEDDPNILGVKTAIERYLEANDVNAIVGAQMMSVPVGEESDANGQT